MKVGVLPTSSDKVVPITQAKSLKVAEEEGSYGDEAQPKLFVFSENFACPEHGAVMEELSPRLFSFNSPYGACPNCHGLGSLKVFSEDQIVPYPNPARLCRHCSLVGERQYLYFSLLYSVGQRLGLRYKRTGAI